MNLFLDTSVLLAACGSDKGASRAIVRLAESEGWTLTSSPYVVNEVLRNLNKLPADSTSTWIHIRKRLSIVDDVVSLDRAAVFPASKDRPVLFTALASSAVLLTLDRDDFAKFLGTEFYSLRVRLPATFLSEERAAGRLRTKLT